MSRKKFVAGDRGLEYEVFAAENLRAFGTSHGLLVLLIQFAQRNADQLHGCFGVSTQDGVLRQTCAEGVIQSPVLVAALGVLKRADVSQLLQKRGQRTQGALFEVFSGPQIHGSSIAITYH